MRQRFMTMDNMLFWVGPTAPLVEHGSAAGVNGYIPTGAAHAKSVYVDIIQI